MYMLCAGYRPILDAMKSFANVRPEDVGDIEDLASKKPCFSSCMVDCETPRRQAVSGVVWYSPQSLPQVFEVLEQCKGKQVAVVCGGTGKGTVCTYVHTCIQTSAIFNLDTHGIFWVQMQFVHSNFNSSTGWSPEKK